jgi:hypothetical protein
VSSENEHGDDPEGGALEPLGGDADAELPVDFKIFVLSLNASALIHLGEAPGADAAGSAAISVSLPMARHTIDMLCMLEDKTRGNLTSDEERLLHQVLFDLRMLYTRKAAG